MEDWRNHPNFSRLTYILKSHNEIRESLQKFRTIALEVKHNESTVKAVFKTLQGEIDKHNEIEDHKIFPHLFYYYSDRCKMKGGFKENDIEHTELHNNMERMNLALETIDDTFFKSVDDFIEAIETHLNNEESRINPVVLELSTYEYICFSGAIAKAFMTGQ
jgi:hypothetical protein